VSLTIQNLTFFAFWGFASLLERWTISNLHAAKVNLPGGRFAPSVPGEYIKAD